VAEVQIAALYAFAPLNDPASLQDSLRDLCEEAGISGTILLADEGINGTVAGPATGIERLLEHLRLVPGFEGLQAKYSTAQAAPFGRLRVRLKQEIVSMGVDGIDPRAQVGRYVDPEEWNRLLADPEVLVVDTRNAYEVRIGTFEGAVDPNIGTFRDFPRWASENIDPTRHKRVAMFCTGGIRCEKATSLLLGRGVEDVMHLNGGILRYLDQMPLEETKWRGECFVFDRRVAVDHELNPGSHSLCFGCLEPLTADETNLPGYEEGICCHRCAPQLDRTTRSRREERMRQVRCAKASGSSHLHVGPSPETLQGRDEA